MGIQAKNSIGQIEVVPALPDQEPVIANLVELYAHDFSEFQELEIGQDGRFGYRDLHHYWSEPGRHPFLIKVDDRPAGFVLVKQGSDISGDRTAWDVAEFFVVRGCRRLGVGKAAAQEVWRRFPGRWEVRVMMANQPARQFWAGAISEFLGETIRGIRTEVGGEHWELFSFASSGVPPDSKLRPM